MTLMVLAHGMRPERLLARVSDFLPRSAPSLTRSTDWGALVLIDAPFGEVGRWLVMGVPQAHPWGIPGTDLPAEQVAAELDRYGPAASQLTSGPLVAVDMSTGAVLRSLNGIIPLAVSSTGPWVASTLPGVVAQLSQSTPLAVDAGSVASPDGTVIASCGLVRSQPVPGVTWSGIDLEIDSRLAALGGRDVIRLARGPALEEDDETRYVRKGAIAQRPVFAPQLASTEGAGTELDRYIRLREETLPRLWFRARLVDLWLCAPAFERPALDLVSSAPGPRGQVVAGARSHPLGAAGR